MIQVNMQNLDSKILITSLCILHVFTFCEGRPLRKRTVSEIQLMHNIGELQQVQERRDWLQMRLRGIHTAPELPDLSDLTPEEIQYALKLLDKLLKTKQS
uniref:Parathyroid hormone n=1 Tax=Labrus bergylta TaxID=56723 RepID=A0A3Q3GVT7_9LABR